MKNKLKSRGKFEKNRVKWGRKREKLVGGTTLKAMKKDSGG